MRQAIHTFRKDTRRSVPYIAVVSGITALLAILTPRWTSVYISETRPLNTTVDLLQLLLPVAWWFTIALLVQGESLVGDRQFWLTRPYSRWSLLFAKILFCVVFLTAPMLAGDCLVLSAEGFSPTALIPGLLWRHCVLADTFMLAAMTLAALTRNTRQFVIACFLLAIGFFVAAQVDFPPKR
jgi:ABC-type transport system involved in multi-copper enzyme maturation permease subunit